MRWVGRWSREAGEGDGNATFEPLQPVATRWVKRAGRAAERLFNTLIPAACVGCGRGIATDGPPLCNLCRSRLPALPAPRCARCAEPLGATQRVAGEAIRCGTCEEWPDYVYAAAAPFAFEDLAARAVHAFKYERWSGMAPYMASTMIDAARSVRKGLEDGGPGDRRARIALVPVPLTPSRKRERGFNQADLLARELAKLETSVGPVKPLLTRGGTTGRQSTLGRRRRQTNVEGRFSTISTFGPETGDAAILVDDVLTTGATALACCQALADAGFQRLGIVSFARTLQPLAGTP